MRPWLFLDFDGVINPFWKPNSQTKADRLTGYNDHEKATVAGYRVIYSPKMIKDLATLPVDVVWASTWVNDLEALSAMSRQVRAPVT